MKELSKNEIIAINGGGETAREVGEAIGYAIGFGIGVATGGVMVSFSLLVKNIYFN